MRCALWILFAFFVTSGLGSASVLAKSVNRGQAWLRCVQSHLDGAGFLHRRNPSRYRLDPVHSMERVLRRAGIAKPADPSNKIAAWLALADRTGRRFKNDAHFRHRLKTALYDQYVLKPDEAPQAYFDLQVQINREAGRGDLPLTPEAKSELIGVLIKDQKQSLDAWLEYFLSDDTAKYPTWAKVWAFEEMSKLRALNSGETKFTNRSRDTTSMFPELNREALGILMDGLTKRVSVHSTPVDKEFRALLEKERFAELYAWTLKRVESTRGDLRVTAGKWVTYPKGSDPQALVRAIDCKGTGWCTVGVSTAASQLKAGDFHVYFSLDSLSEPTQPRIAIRMEEQKIAEVRGIAKDQNLDPHIAPTEILEKKLSEFGVEGDKYKKRSSDMKRLTELAKMNEAKQALTRDELKFLYEVDNPIEGFGYQKDPRISEIIETRDKRADLAKALDVAPEKISFTEAEALRGGIAFHYGDLEISGRTSIQNLKLPKRVRGNFTISSPVTAKGLVLPEHVEDGFNFLDLEFETAQGLVLPRYVGGDVYMPNLRSALGLVLPRHVGGHLDLSRIRTGEGLVLPNYVGKHLDLSGIRSAEGLVLPSYVGTDLMMTNLRSVKGVTMAKYVGRELNLNGLETSEGFVPPDKVKVILMSRIPPSERDGLKNRYPNHRFRFSTFELNMREPI